MKVFAWCLDPNDIKNENLYLQMPIPYSYKKCEIPIKHT